MMDDLGTRVEQVVGGRELEVMVGRGRERERRCRGQVRSKSGETVAAKRVGA